ncbi:DUF559 domain-containing protein [Saccharibacillus sp. CPCC 101409]|uniref:DUF559 domain-containing protein n=1 Tax=Saccharibacillus sp. CPCC 101409 TaxID=3058041 RepID=UPI0026712D9B|nr:DUF559 domain-containing protein [Saccharibacillus sp. CPCC 101409]MDO3412178.1 DUF559 domain-containing protein [Saccharibacillus sp. CPCC 101409]
MEFIQAHDAFIARHLAGRTGERRDRLARGHREAERLFCMNVWWPLRGNFDHLHPEYEVLDWRGLRYFCDFVWIAAGAKIVIEIKGFGSHIQDMDRRKFCTELNRETFLSAMGFHVISFAYDDVAHRPELCITLLRMVMARFQKTLRTNETESSNEHIGEFSIVRLACTLGRPIRPTDLRKQFGLNYRASVKIMRLLCERGLFAPVRGAEGKYTVGYTLQSTAFTTF